MGKFGNNEVIIFSCLFVIGRGWFFKKWRSFVVTNKFIYIIKST